MNTSIIEDCEIITIEEKEFIEQFIHEIPFYWRPASTSEKFPYYAHRLVSRPNYDNCFNSNSPIQIESEYFHFFLSILNRFCEKHQIKYSNILRGFVNSVFFQKDYPSTDPHVDSYVDHFVVLMYLNKISLSSPTLIYKKEQHGDAENMVLDISKFKNKFIPIKKKIYPVYGKICAFDGKYYHSNKFPLPGENRIVCVFNLLK